MDIVKRVGIEFEGVQPQTMCWDWVWRCPTPDTYYFHVL